jgi:glyoxylase-like metal-dependent hydrolase (beta-lactamase superfamily II)
VQVPLTSEAVADLQQTDVGTREVSSDLAYRRLAMVNVVFIGTPGENWVLIDAGITGFTKSIEATVEERFAGSAPAAIVLTHGHFDHIGCLTNLAEKWNVPIFAHDLEVPYLNGSRAYSPPDPTVGGGVMPLLAPLFPRGPIDVSHWLQPLPDDGSLPHLAGWRWIHTPGHTPGHISLWRERDRTIIAGDAFITTNQESAYAVAMQAEEMHGPPKYFTPDWSAAKSSVQSLAALEPNIVVTGHGRAMRGPQMLAALQRLAGDFDRIAVPH